MNDWFAHCQSLEEARNEYHRLCFEHHPDRGGDTTTMQAINTAYERFKREWTKRPSATPTNFRHKRSVRIWVPPAPAPRASHASTKGPHPRDYLRNRNRHGGSSILVMMLLGVLLSIGMILMLNPPSLGGISRLSPTSTATPIQVAANSTELQEPDVVPPTPTPSPTTTPPTATQATPTRSPTALATSTPIATATTAPTATPIPKSTTDPVVIVALDQIADATATLRSGQIEVVNEQQDGARVLMTVRFNLEDDGQEPRLRSITTLESPRGTTITEQIIVGDQAWQRQPDGTWTTIQDQRSVMEQVQAFLPDVDTALDAHAAIDGDTTEVRWFDEEQEADVTVRLDADDAVLRQMHRVTRGDGEVLTVTFRNWNTFIDIISPDGT